MIEHVKKKLSKRELYERDGFTKHGCAKPYKREPLHQVVMSEEDKLQHLKHLLGDWDMDFAWLDEGDN